MDDQRSELRRWLAALSSENSAERNDAAESPPEGALDDEIVAGLMSLLHDPSDVVRLCAAETLGRYPGPQAAATTLATVLEVRDDDAAVQAIEQCAERETIDALRDDLTAARRRLQGIEGDPD